MHIENLIVMYCTQEGKIKSKERLVLELGETE